VQEADKNIKKNDSLKMLTVSAASFTGDKFIQLMSSFLPVLLTFSVPGLNGQYPSLARI
jgi:hypothetical protein